MSSTLFSVPVDLPKALRISLPKSKSIANRLLILKSLSKANLVLHNLGNSNDVLVLQRALNADQSKINVEDAGTAARFTLAWACMQFRELEISGTERMHERPMAPLIEALRALGFTIQCLEKEGFLPVKILPVDLHSIGHEVQISSNISSQFISALALIAPFLPNGLKLKLTGRKSSWPYVQMTLSLLRSLAVEVVETENAISITPNANLHGELVVENDWSAAAFWYQLACAFPDQEFCLGPMVLPSIQGDSIAHQLFDQLGISSQWRNEELFIIKNRKSAQKVSVNFEACPDLAQAFICTCAMLQIEGEFQGLHTLQHKESNRLEALSLELQKLNVHLDVIGNSTAILHRGTVNKPKTILSSHNDHRMAMCLAPFAFYTSLALDNTHVVSKSYPDYWQELEKLGLHLRHESSGTR